MSNPGAHRLRQMMDQLGGGLNSMDDRVQEFARNTYKRGASYLPESIGGPVDMFGDYLHTDRRDYEDTWQGKTALYGSRAAQAGGVTAAGLGLIDLTHAMASSFGGPADDAGPGTLPM